MPLALRAVLGSLENTDAEVVTAKLSPYPDGVGRGDPAGDHESVLG